MNKTMLMLASAAVSLAGCNPSITPVPPAPAPPTGACVITPQSAVTVPAGTSTSIYFETTGCNTTFNSGATPTPVQWRVVAGVIPTGMTGPNSQGTTFGNVIGAPSIAGTYRFTLQVTDQLGATDQETGVDPARARLGELDQQSLHDDLTVAPRGADQEHADQTAALGRRE